MAQTTVVCPECGTEQTSAYGFAPAQTVRCRRCAASFRTPGAKRVTAAVADDEEDERPRAKRWLLGGFVFLLLVAVAVVGGVMYVEAQRERAEEDLAAAEEAREDAEVQAARAMRRPPPRGERQPDGNPFFNVAPPPTAKQTAQMTAALSRRLVGVWEGAGREVEYRAEGTFRDGPLLGTWKAIGMSGTKVLKVERSAGRSPVRVTFEGDELIHDGDGNAVVLRKK